MDPTAGSGCPDLGGVSGSAAATPPVLQAGQVSAGGHCASTLGVAQIEVQQRQPGSTHLPGEREHTRRSKGTALNSPAPPPRRRASSGSPRLTARLLINIPSRLKTSGPLRENPPRSGDGPCISKPTLSGAPSAPGGPCACKRLVAAAMRSAHSKWTPLLRGCSLELMSKSHRSRDWTRRAPPEYAGEDWTSGR